MKEQTELAVINRIRKNSLTAEEMFAGYEALSIVLDANTGISKELDTELLLGKIKSVEDLKEFFIRKYTELKDECQILKEILQ
jgi:hypothetical protein